VFIDIDPNTLCFDLVQLKALQNNKIQAILITYLFGMVPEMRSLIDLCQQKKLFIIEDFSQCLNGKYDGYKLGGFGDVGIYSASSIKTLDTYGGGLAVTNNHLIATQLVNAQASLSSPSRKLLIKRIATNLVRNCATNRFIFHIFTFNLIRFISYFKPGIAIKHTGVRDKNMLMSLPNLWFTSYTSFQAKVGMDLLKKVAANDFERISNANYIKEQVNGVSFPIGASNGSNVYWQLVAYFKYPIKVQKYLQKKKIDSSTTSLEKLTSLDVYPFQVTTPNADNLFNKALFIPAYPGLQKKDINHIINVLNQLDKN
jgi:dTDP-4-amino-4,6-dideoxygalactose transaminase